MTEIKNSEPLIDRDRVVDVFKKIVERGIKNPDDLPLDDQDVINANALMRVWMNQRDKQVKKIGLLISMFEFSFEKSVLFVDAGFTDPGYLNEVANEWLAQDLQVAGHLGYIDLATKIKNKIDEINSKIEISRA